MRGAVHFAAMDRTCSGNMIHWLSITVCAYHIRFAALHGDVASSNAISRKKLMFALGADGPSRIGILWSSMSACMHTSTVGSGWMRCASGHVAHARAR